MSFGKTLFFVTCVLCLAAFPADALADKNTIGTTQDVFIETVKGWDGDISRFDALFKQYGINSDFKDSPKYIYARTVFESIVEACQLSLKNTYCVSRCTKGNNVSYLKNHLDEDQYQKITSLINDLCTSVGKYIARRQQKKKEELAERQRIAKERAELARQQRIAKEKKETEQRQLHIKEREEAEKQSLLKKAASVGLTGYYKGVANFLNDINKGVLSYQKAKTYMVISIRNDTVFKVSNLIDRYVIYISRPYGTFQFALLNTKDKLYQQSASLNEEKYFKLVGKEKFSNAFGQINEMLIFQELEI